MSEKEQPNDIKDIFQNSRDMAILRCTEIMIDSGRADLARQILMATKIDRNRLAELKTLSKEDASI